MAETELLEVRTGCRLHFGLMELAPGQPLRFGGLGLMLSEPSLQIDFRASQQTRIAFDSAVDAEVNHRIGAVLELRNSLLGSSRHYGLRVKRALPLHNGLGAGTQLASTVAIGLELIDRCRSSQLDGGNRSGQWKNVCDLSRDFTTEWLVKFAARGLRSAVGLEGFLRGGLILDQGYCETDSDVDVEDVVNNDSGCSSVGRPVHSRVSTVPSNWRVILARPAQCEPMSGKREADLMAKLGRSVNTNKYRMLELAEQAMAIADCSTGSAADFEPFTNLLDRYMHYAAKIFEDSQGGMYNGPAITEAVATFRRVGLCGVGQSSWGPIVFGFAQDAAAAESSLRRLSDYRQPWSIAITTPAAQGAQWRAIES